MRTGGTAKSLKRICIWLWSITIILGITGIFAQKEYKRITANYTELHRRVTALERHSD